MSRRALWLSLPLVAAGVAAAAIFSLRGRPEPPPSQPSVPVVAPVPAPVSGPGPVPVPVPATPPPSDPVLRRWHAAVKKHDRRAVEELQAAFLSQEDACRDGLRALASTDSDPRIRAFSVAALGRFQAPPPEAFFIERLSDESEYPRSSAVAALEKRGSAACLPALDRLAASDPSPGVRGAAAAAAKQVRAR